MIKNSIIVKITILFLIAIIGLSAFSYYFIREEIDRKNYENQLKYTQFLATINQLVRFGGNITLIEKYLNELGLVQIKNTEILDLFEAHITPNFNHGVIAKIIKEEGGIYLFLQTPQDWRVYGDIHFDRLFNYYIITFIAFVIVVFLFVLVIRSILPLKTLQKEIRKFANGQMDISCKINQNDEIGELAQEFDNAVQKINALNQSRHLFLRSIMHELKTPITKGRITAEMIDNPLYKERLCSVFERLNSLINEFAKIEELSSRNYCPNKQKILLQDVLKRVFEMLLLDEEQITSLFILPQNQQSLYADFEMISLVIKNLVDNAIKYKTQGQIEICIAKKDLWIKNYGNPLPYTLKDHSKPFFKDSKSNTSGLGLGIYIIKSTLETQGLELDYFHQNNQNIFIIKGVVSQKNLKDENV
ncbi:ArsS family sensor histidine kinase [Helicobacter pullorum]|uniref:histidine kinase n=3 Tax=Helicobacter pullorum TaxID=35818 RepID=A0A0N1E8B4_9HELI|nr:ArsS family sensor histidine kinase [Helicobacter pullorum]HIS08511.1 HAMP domain-containing histidine kinase [Candidatus Scatomorpha intestinipullorum]EEQ63845.1 HAMP domain protein [Helicobacter pullorum MIT 98-5489]KAB0574764.1 HAMP domain-containing histidine kinase [Helicobacter pullorum NCTC 12824]KPH50264.1 histidine kinase [Helicobacter pullorum]KPH52055.1 histidine kinase [Helicobacter pullorum]